MGVCGSHRKHSEEDKSSKERDKQIENKLNEALVTDEHASRYSDEAQLGGKRNGAPATFESLRCVDHFNEKPYHMINPKYLSPKEKIKSSGATW